MTGAPPGGALAGIDRNHGLHLLREMVCIRRLEERCVEPYSATQSAAC